MCRARVLGPHAPHRGRERRLDVQSPWLVTSRRRPFSLARLVWLANDGGHGWSGSSAGFMPDYWKSPISIHTNREYRETVETVYPGAARTRIDGEPRDMTPISGRAPRALVSIREAAPAPILCTQGSS